MNTGGSGNRLIRAFGLGPGNNKQEGEMRRSQRFAVYLIVVATALLNGFGQQASASPFSTIVDSFNATATGNGGQYNIPDIGWFYTPGFSYLLDDIGAKFTTSDGRTVTALIFSGAPGNLKELGQGDFTPVANTFVDGSFQHPVLL